MNKNIKPLIAGSAAVILGIVCGMGLTLGYRTVVADLASSSGSSGGSQAQPAAASSSSALAASAVAVAKPAELVIPAIGVDAPVVGVGVAANGDLGVPSDAVHVAWYEYGPRPGEPGAAVIDGHLDTIHAPQAVFYNLHMLAVGDKIQVITGAGELLTFQVTGTETLPYNAPTDSIFHPTSTVPQLDLITCAGDWVRAIKLYDRRFVVFSELVSSSTPQE